MFRKKLCVPLCKISFFKVMPFFFRNMPKALLYFWQLLRTKVFFLVHPIFMIFATYMHIDHMQPQPKEDVCRKHRFCLRSHQIYEVFQQTLRRKLFLISKNSKFRIRYHHRKVLTYLCVKDHVSKSCHFFRKWSITFF